MNSTIGGFVVFHLCFTSSREVGVGKGLNVKGKQGAPVMSFLEPGLLDGMLLTPFCNRLSCWDGIENVKNMCMMWVAHVSSTCNYLIFGHGDLKVFFDAVFCTQHFCFKMYSYIWQEIPRLPWQLVLCWGRQRRTDFQVSCPSSKSVNISAPKRNFQTANLFAGFGCHGLERLLRVSS